MQEIRNELFWNANIDELKKGYVENEEEYVCVLCSERFIKGKVYPLQEDWYDARKMAELHIQQAHGSMLSYLLDMNNSFLGVTEVQAHLLNLLGKGNDDKDVAKEMNINPSTVRNHRYRLREKEKQAKLFLTLMQLLEAEQKKPIGIVEQSKICEMSKTATMVDDRYDVTEAEKDKIIKTYFDETGKLKNYPSKEKRKIIVLEKLSHNFKQGRFYSEAEINRILTRTCQDHVALRRALIEYGFMERATDGMSYWLKG